MLLWETTVFSYVYDVFGCFNPVVIPNYFDETVVSIQVVSIRDIYHSSIDASFKNPQQRRLLRFGLTDGKCEAVAIEFSHIPFITEEIAPGTKVS
jgi:hypothetical protein